MCGGLRIIERLKRKGRFCTSSHSLDTYECYAVITSWMWAKLQWM